MFWCAVSLSNLNTFHPHFIWTQVDWGGLESSGPQKAKLRWYHLKKKKSLFNFVKPSNLLRVLIIFLQILLYFHIFFTYFYNL